MESRTLPFADGPVGSIDGEHAINNTLVGSGSSVQRQLMIEASRSR
ncbi:hypothetical protein [Synechococcus sp. MIT S9503]